jgi:mono/diheme cytochrome c family protein
MPQFTLSEAEIATIIAYINSLATPGTSNPVVPISDATDNGDLRKGFAYAEQFCSDCHNILTTDAASPNRQAPSFKKVANIPGMSLTALTVWSRTSHPTMPNLVIESADMDNLIAYILSLRDR